jgi:hypothetical protein
MVQIPVSSIPRSAEQLQGMRVRAEEIQNQIERAADQRKEITEQLQGGTPSEARPGLEQQLRIIDARIAALEQDLTTTNRLVTAATPEAHAQWQAQEHAREARRGDDDEAEMFFLGGGGGILLALFAVAVRRRFRRGRDVRRPAARCRRSTIRASTGSARPSTRSRSRWSASARDSASSPSCWPRSGIRAAWSARAPRTRSVSRAGSRSRRAPIAPSHPATPHPHRITDAPPARCVMRCVVRPCRSRARTASYRVACSARVACSSARVAASKRDARSVISAVARAGSPSRTASLTDGKTTFE